MPNDGGDQTLTMQKLTGIMGALMQPAINDAYVSPRPASRVGKSRDASEYLERNRGTLSLFQPAGDDRAEAEEPSEGCCSARNPRILGRDAVDIFRRSFGTMDRFMNVDQNVRAGYSSPRPQPRLPSEDAEKNARRNAGVLGQPALDPRMAVAINRQPRRAVQGEGEANATRGAGTMNLILNTEANRNFALPRPGSRALTAEAQRNAQLGKGSMSTILSDSSAAPPSRAVEPRGRAITNIGSSDAVICGLSSDRGGGGGYEAPAPARRANKELGTKGTLGALMATYDSPPQDLMRPRTAPSYNRGDGLDNARHGQQGTLGSLMKTADQQPSRNVRSATRIRPEARNYVSRGKGGTMSLYISPTKPQYSNHKHSYLRKTKTVSKPK